MLYVFSFLDAISMWLPALDSCLLAFEMIDIVCLGLVSLFPGFVTFRVERHSVAWPVFLIPGLLFSDR